MDNNLKQLIRDEVARLMEPISSQVTEVKRQNGEQSTLLAMQVRKIDAVGDRLKALYGNGTGPPGYLEIARKEDRDKYDQLFQMVTTLNAERLREEGKAEVLRQLDQKKDKRIARIQKWAGLIAIPALSSIWTLLRPLIHAYFTHVATKIQ